MRRRQLLAGAGGALATGFAGCVRSGHSNGGGDVPPDGTATPTETDNPTATPTPESRLVDHEFSVVDAGCGTETERATVTFDGDTVRVDGTTTGPNGCYTADLADVVADEGRLDVTVTTRKRDGAEACVECLVEIDYEATFTFEGSLPDRVVVAHDDRQVADRRR
jgi:hypothetical protein